MGSGERTKFDNKAIDWIDERLPIFTLLNREYAVFPTPKNFNYFWNFGAIAMVMLTIMIVSGIVLAMHYTANIHYAFDSVERIMRDVNGGWLIRYIHMNGASFFFIAVYTHIFRCMYYGSYKKPRELIWILGVLIFLLMMATAFMGYVLPWGQMSYWGATVITNLFSAIPLVGESIVTLLWGGFSVDNPTLNRFFALHYLLPFVIFAVVFLHIWAIHVKGSNNPLGIDTKGDQDTVPFHPYYTIKDSVGILAFLIVYALFVFYMPDALGHPDNYTPANPMVTPAHIVPEWYFLPFYAMLRAITFGFNPYILLALVFLAAAIAPLYTNRIRVPYSNFHLNFSLKRTPILAAIGGVLFLLGYLCQIDGGGGHKIIPLPLGDLFFIDAKLGGVIAMFGSILLLFVLPWLDWHPIRSANFRPLYKMFFLIWAVNFVILGYIGSQPADAHIGPVPLSLVGLACTGYYFGFLVVILPWLANNEKGRDLPLSIHHAVLAKHSKPRP